MQKTDNTTANTPHCQHNNFLYRLSMQIAPNGAVMRIDSTATVNTVCPQANPIVKGIAPRLVFIKDIATLSILKTKVPMTNFLRNFRRSHQHNALSTKSLSKSDIVFEIIIHLSYSPY